MTTIKRNKRPKVRFTKTLISRICRGVALGKSLRRVLRTSGMPSKSAFMDWVANNPNDADQYARARVRCIECRVDRLLDEIDEATPATAHVTRLKVDTIKWLAGKLIPRVYGDKLNVAAELAVEHKNTGDPDARLLEVARTIGAVLIAADRLKSGRVLDLGEAIELPAPAPAAPEAVTSAVTDSGIAWPPPNIPAPAREAEQRLHNPGAIEDGDFRGELSVAAERSEMDGRRRNLPISYGRGFRGRR